MSTARSEFFRFACVGVVGTLAHYAVLWLGTDLVGFSAVAGSAVGAVAGSIVNYLLNYHITFTSKLAHATTLLKFYVIAGTGWLLNLALMAFLVNEAGVYHWWAQWATTGVCLCWNFVGSKWWAFRERR